jgi:hypothetical protein
MSLLKRLRARADQNVNQSAEPDRHKLERHEPDRPLTFAGDALPPSARHMGLEQFPDGEKLRVLRTRANAQCRAEWLRPWRSREAPIFEGGWCCSAACTRAQVEAGLPRDRRPDTSDCHALKQTRQAGEVFRSDSSRAGNNHEDGKYPGICTIGMA